MGAGGGGGERVLGPPYCNYRIIERETPILIIQAPILCGGLEPHNCTALLLGVFHCLPGLWGLEGNVCVCSDAGNMAEAAAVIKRSLYTRMGLGFRA